MKMILTTCLATIMIVVGSGLAQAQDSSQVSVDAVYFSEQELDQMLAPITLYPDTVLAHILIAATYPLEVVQAARWTEKNTGIEGDQALQAVEDEEWDPSVKALVPFPDLLQRMSNELDWTQDLGDAFLDDEERVTARIQNLRQKAYAEGSLNSLEHLKVVKEKETIVIEPAVREVVYVPYYDSRYVYGSWWWDSYPPIYWDYPHHHYTHTSFYWGPRVHLSAGFFFSGFLWHDHHVVVIDHHRYRSNHYYSSRQVVRHNDSRRWHHNPQHRRGVDYRNPRTRDYFERRRLNSSNQDRNQVTRTTSSRSTKEVRASRQQESGGKNLRTNRELRNADYVRNRLQADTNSNRGEQRTREDVQSKRLDGRPSTQREAGIANRDTSRPDRSVEAGINKQKRNPEDGGNVKLRQQDPAPKVDTRAAPDRSQQAYQRSESKSVEREARSDNASRRSETVRENTRSDRGRSDVKSSQRSSNIHRSSGRDNERSTRERR